LCSALLTNSCCKKYTKTQKVVLFSKKTKKGLALRVSPVIVHTIQNFLGKVLIKFAGVIHMKKTIIAAAVAAVVSAPAMADVSISGNVMAEHYDAGNGGQITTRNDLVFKASEDLGNGMKAAIKMHQVLDNTDTAGADRTVSLSGDFGTITAGEMEGFQEGTFDSFIEVDAAHDTTLEATYWDNGTAGFTRASRVMYVSPSMNGVSVGITASGADGDEFSDKEIMVKYSGNGATVMAGKGEVDGGNEFTNLAMTYKMGDLELRAAYRNVDRAAVAGTDASLTDIQDAAASVAGDLVNANADAAAGTLADGDLFTNAAGGIATYNAAVAAVTAADLTSTFIGAKYTMGANVIGLGMVDSETQDANIYSLQHNLSKSTSVYISHLDPADDDSRTVIGLAKKF
jgi:hypothetical protein